MTTNRRRCGGALGTKCRRFFGFAGALLAAMLANAANAAAEASPVGDGVREEEKVELDISNADLHSMLQLLEMLSGRKIIRAPGLPALAATGLHFDQPVSREKAVDTIAAVLFSNQIAVIPLENGLWKAAPFAAVRAEGVPMVEDLNNLPYRGLVVSRLFRLKHQRVGEVGGQIQQVTSAAIPGGFIPLEKANAALVTDHIANLRRIEEILRVIDAPVRTDFYKLRNARAAEVVDRLRTMEAGAPSPAGLAITLSADERTNQVMVTADDRTHESIARIVANLDEQASSPTGVSVIYLRHASAKDVESLLNGLMSKSGAGAKGAPSTAVNAPNAPPAPLPASPGDAGVRADSAAIEGTFSALSRVNSDERSNAVILSGTTHDQVLFQKFIEKIDVPLAQVRIEVVIAEIQLGDSSASGISELGLIIDGDKLVGIAGAVPGLATGTGGLAISRPGADNDVSGRWDLAGQLRLTSTPRKNRAEILSVPVITTTHNKPASVFVGESRPVITGTQSVNAGNTGGETGFTTSSTVAQQDVGISLKVKPLVGADDSVQLEITQEVNEVGASVLINGNEQPVVLKRSTASFVSVRSGEIIVLGGLQKNRNTHSTSRLGPVPVIGDLLGARSRSVVRTELIFFVRPTVIKETPSQASGALHSS